MGYSIGENVESRNREFRPSDRGSSKEKTIQGSKSGDDLLEDLIDEIINSNRQSDLLESQTPLLDTPLGHDLRREDRTRHSYASDEFDCQKFQQDVKKVFNARISAIIAPPPSRNNKRPTRHANKEEKTIVLGKLQSNQYPSRVSKQFATPKLTPRNDIQNMTYAVSEKVP